MSWRDWTNGGIQSQFNLCHAVGDEAEIWHNGLAKDSLR